MLEWFAAYTPQAASAVFLDRDGVLNVHIADGYVLTKSDFRWLPGAIDAVRRLCRAGYPVFIVTNQSCINAGLLSAETFRSIMLDLVATLDVVGASIAGWVCCPHRRDEGCPCRKPGTAMLERAAAATGTSLAGARLIGDSASDVEAAHRAGIRGFLVERNAPQALAELVDRIVRGIA